MSSNSDDIRVRIAGDLADINKALRDLKTQAAAAGREAQRSSRDWGSLGKGLDGLKRQVVGLVGAYAGFRGVVALFRSVITNTIEAEDVAAQLEARVRSTGGAAGFTSEQLLAMAKSLQGVTTFGDEAIASMETLLLTFTNVRGTEFQAATVAVLDMATALKTDLSSAATQVGKALQDPARGIVALTRAGVTFSAQQKQLIKTLVETNDVAGAQRVILDELTKKFGGAASAARDTFGGSLAALKEAFGDLFEGEGSATSTAAAINDLIDVLQEPATIQAFQTLTAAILGVVTAFTSATAAIVNGLSRTVEDVKAAFSGGDAAQLTRRLENLRESLELVQKANQREPSEEGEAIARGLRKEIELVEELARARTAAARPLSDAERAGFAAEAGTGRTAAAVIPVDPRPALKAMQSQLAAAGKVLDDELKRVGKALDAEFADNLVRFDDYFSRRAELERQAVDQQLNAQRTALQLLDEEIRLAEERGDEIEEQENKRKSLVAEITVLERQRGDVATNAARAQLEAERALTEQLSQVRQRLLELQGNTVAARSLELSAEFEDLLARLAAEGDVQGQELVRNLINVELARTRLNDLETEYQRTLAALARAEKRVEIEVETGVISEREGRRQIIQLHRDTAAEVEKLIPLMRELAEASGDPAAVERVRELELEVEKLGAKVNTAARELRETMRDAGEDAFSSILDGTREAGDALDGFIQSFRSKIADLVAENLFEKLFSVLGGVGGRGEQGGGGFFAKLFAGVFHKGGIAGLATAFRKVPALAFAGAPRYHSGGIAGDEVPAILRRGEEVLTRDDPRHRGNAGGGITNINISTPDARSFRRESPGQLAADVATMLARARNRNGG
jgi:hypothetical protein